MELAPGRKTHDNTNLPRREMVMKELAAKSRNTQHIAGPRARGAQESAP
jgi:hypothetical protein